MFASDVTLRCCARASRLALGVLSLLVARDGAAASDFTVHQRVQVCAPLRGGSLQPVWQNATVFALPNGGNPGHYNVYTDDHWSVVRWVPAGTLRPMPPGGEGTGTPCQPDHNP